jgi:sulfoxide reductase heme-binding subunit YedZ
MATAAIGTHLFWITSRAAGIVALILAGASVGVGVSIGGRLIRGRGPDLRAIHEALSLAAIVALFLHVASLLGDSYFHASIAEVTVPFVRSYREPYMAIGILAGWSLVVLGLSYYVRERIGIARWKVLHRFTALAWLLGVIHTLGEGSDAGRTWFLVVVSLAVIPVLGLVAARLLGSVGRSAPSATAA